MKKSMSKSQFLKSDSYAKKKATENSAYSHYKDEIEAGVQIPENHKKKAALLFKNLDKAVEAAGGYNTGVGASHTGNQVGVGGFVPHVAKPLVKRLLTESAFLKSIVQPQVMPTSRGEIFGVRMMSGEIGQNDLNDLDNELGRPQNNFVQAGGLKLMFEGEAEPETSSGEGDGKTKITSFRLVDGSYKETSVITGDATSGYTMTNIPGNKIGTTNIEGDLSGTPTTIPVSWDYNTIASYVKSEVASSTTQLYAALDIHTREKFANGVFNTPAEAEVILKAMAITGVGINPQYGIGLEDFASDIDPDRTSDDLATNVFSGGSAGEGADSKFHKVTPRIEFEQLNAEERSNYVDIVRNLEEDIAKTMGVDYQEMIVDQLKRIMIQQIDIELITAMKKLAVDTTNGGSKAKVFNVGGAGTTDVQGQWLQQKLTTLITAMAERGEHINRMTRRLGRGDFSIVTPTVSALLTSAGSLYNKFEIDSKRNSSSAELGNIAGFDIYTDIWGEIVDVNTGYLSGSSPMIVGLKAKGEGESGLIFGTYKPLEVSGPVKDPTTHNKTLLLTTRYGIADNVIDSGAFYDAVLVKGATEAIYGG